MPNFSIDGNSVGASFSVEKLTLPEGMFDGGLKQFLPEKEEWEYEPPEDFSYDPSGITPVDPTWGWFKAVGWDTLKGTGQGGLNAINGVQDIVIGTVNIATLPYNGTTWVVNQIWGEGTGTYFWVPSPDWSRGMLIDEYGEPGSWTDTHGWSKWAGGNGLMAAAGALGPKMSISGTKYSPAKSGYHFTFKVKGKWYEAVGDRGYMEILTHPSNPIVESGRWGSSVKVTVEGIPLLFNPAVPTRSYNCATAAFGTWFNGGGPAFIVAPFAHLFNPKPDPEE